MKRVFSNLSYSNVVSTLCLVLLLGGGTAYAASTLGKESVGAKQLAKEAVTPSKLSKASKKTLTGPAGPQGIQGLKGDKGEKGEKGEQGEAGAPATALWAEVSYSGTLMNHSPAATGSFVIPGFPGQYEVDFNRNVANCAYVATSFNGGLVPETEPRSGNPNGVFLDFQNKEGVITATQFYVAVFC